ncbi:MAG: DUF2927 domain-containing protein [Clostridia bacterium]|nr:DUF2927 domain-containing protein [Clostridia bacterium]
MKHLLRPGMALLLSLWLLFPLSSPALAKTWRPSSEADASQEALSIFSYCAFHPEYGDEDNFRLTRWAQEITLWLGGAPTPEDRAVVDEFIQQLQQNVPHLPPIHRVKIDTQANIRLWFIPLYSMGYYLTDYVEDNWGFFTYEHPQWRIVSARVGIASDITTQEERNHLILEELVGALGLPGDHEVYEDSILYQAPTTTQALSDLDWRMLNLLYDPRVFPGMTEGQAREALREN